MKHTVEEFKLSNGIRGLLIDVPGAEVVEYQFIFRAGYYLCPPEKVELAHLTEHMVFAANQVYQSLEKYNSEILKNGAECDAFTSAQYITYYCKCADFEWERLFKLFISGISQPLFLEEEFRSELQVIKEELQRIDDYRYILSDILDKQLGFVSRTAKEGLISLDKIDLEDVRRFYNQTHFSGNMAFIMTGNIKDRGEKITNLLNNFDLPVNKENKLLDAPKQKLHGLNHLLSLKYESVPNLYYSFNVLSTQKLSDSEKLDLEILKDLLINFSESRIFCKARKLGLLYDGGSCFFGNTVSSSFFGLENQVATEKALPLFDLIQKEFSTLLSGNLETEEVERFKQTFSGPFYLDLETVSNIANIYRYEYLDNGRIINYETIAEQMKSVNSESITQTLRKMFSEKQLALGILGKAADELKTELHQKITAIQQ